MKTMSAVVFRGQGRVAVEDVTRPSAGPGEAVVRITTTTICGTAVHIVRGEYPVKPGLVLGHEPVGVIEELGPGPNDRYQVGQRVIAGGSQRDAGRLNAATIRVPALRRVTPLLLELLAILLVAQGFTMETKFHVY